jgi:hypothetical protein
LERIRTGRIRPAERWACLQAMMLAKRAGGTSGQAGNAARRCRFHHPKSVFRDSPLMRQYANELVTPIGDDLPLSGNLKFSRLPPWADADR